MRRILCFFLLLVSAYFYTAQAACEDNCVAQRDTCLKGCNNITDATQKSNCSSGCWKGQDACLLRCGSASTNDTSHQQLAALPQCVEQNQACTLHGTSCCDPYECKGTFPNTTCQ